MWQIKKAHVNYYKLIRYKITSMEVLTRLEENIALKNKEFVNSKALVLD